MTKTRSRKVSRKVSTKHNDHHAELDKVLSIVVDYAKMLGFPVPPMDRMEKMIKSVSHDIHVMFAGKKSKKQLQGSDILVLMLKMGLITVFALPIIKKLMTMESSSKEKKGKVTVESQPMVD